MRKFFFDNNSWIASRNRRRIATVVVLLISMMVAFEPLRSVQGVVRSKAELLLTRMNESVVSTDEANNGKGEGFLKIFKSPFKGVSKLFGHGRKDDNKLHRLNEKDVEKFESARTVQINDATSAPIAPESNANMSASDYVERGRYLLDHDNVNEAITALSAAITIDPKLAEAHSLLGVAYGRKGLTEFARKSFETALKLDKKNVQILNNLGYLLICDGEYKAAADKLKKAAKLSPNDPRVLNNLALAQSHLGKFDEAYQNFTRAGGEIDGRLNMANQLELAGRSDDARKQYEAARLQAEIQQKADPSQSIEVILEIQNGLVTYASIAHPRPGFAAYERSALRIARQRRYPADKNGRESLVIKISPFPNS